MQEAGQHREGNRPTRQLYEITDAGRHALAELRREGLSEVWFKYDPFDLALTRRDPASLDDLPTILAQRLEKARALLADKRKLSEKARATVGLAKQWALRHTEYRLEAEVAYLSDLLEAARDIMSEELTSNESQAPTT